MFIRSKKRGDRVYLQVVENYRDNGAPRQRVLWTIGRLDILQQRGQLDTLLSSGMRFSEKLAVVTACRKDRDRTKSQTVKIGPALVMEKLWKDLGIAEVLESAVIGRRYEFSVERAVFLTVLHRLFVSGSDRAAEKWKHGYRINGAEDLELQHLYRAMAWLGEELPADEQRDATPFSPRCTKDAIEEKLFGRRKDLFSELDLVFFDTTSIYFEGEGGETIGRHGKSKDHRPDLKQMVVGVVLDNTGNPICSELWPGNTTDVQTLVPVVDRLKKRFRIGNVCIVADRGMISNKAVGTIESEQYGWKYILGARMRRVNEVKNDVLGRPGRYQEVHPERIQAKDPSPLKVKEVELEGRRYVVCLNEEEARKDRADREAIVASLEEKLKQGDKSLVGNKGYRRYLKTGAHFEIDRGKVKEDARYDGKWVLRTNTDLGAEQVALKYKQLWMVEQIFRSMKSLLETRPIWHKCDETIRGHVFCSFLALILRKELQDRLEAKGWSDVEWADLIHDVGDLHEIETVFSGKRFVLREECRGATGKALQAAGVTLPPSLREA
jgi:transposase